MLFFKNNLFRKSLNNDDQTNSKYCVKLIMQYYKIYGMFTKPQDYEHILFWFN